MTNLRYYITSYVTVMVFFFVFNTITHAECSYNDASPIVFGTFQGKAMVAYSDDPLEDSMAYIFNVQKSWNADISENIYVYPTREISAMWFSKSNLERRESNEPFLLFIDSFKPLSWRNGKSVAILYTCKGIVKVEDVLKGKLTGIEIIDNYIQAYEHK